MVAVIKKNEYIELDYPRSYKISFPDLYDKKIKPIPDYVKTIIIKNISQPIEEFINKADNVFITQTDKVTINYVNDFIHNFPNSNVKIIIDCHNACYINNYKNLYAHSYFFCLDGDDKVDKKNRCQNDIIDALTNCSYMITGEFMEMNYIYNSFMEMNYIYIQNPIGTLVYAPIGNVKSKRDDDNDKNELQKKINELTNENEKLNNKINNLQSKLDKIQSITNI